MKSITWKIITLLILAAAVFAFGRATPNTPARVSAAPLQPFDPNQVAKTPPPPGAVLDLAGVQHLQAGGARLSIAPQTGGVNFLVLSPAQAMAQMSPAAQLLPEDSAKAFLQTNRALFGMIDAGKELSLETNKVDNLGSQHLTYTQTYQGLPVFGGMIKVHFNASGQIAVVNGLFVPEIALSVTPALSAAAAEAAAEQSVNKPGAVAQKTTLMIYRDGLTQGIPGANHLAYEVEVGSGLENGDLVYLDAHTGKVLNTITGVVEMRRVIYQYPGADPVWDEALGVPYSGADPEVQAMINVSGSTYQLYQNISGGSYRSFNGVDGVMKSIVDYSAVNYCPNASWDGEMIRACDGLAVDDVIAHEWSHAYTDYNHNLIYQWQPGALNESYSDIFGEIVDLLNGEGLDSPNVVRENSTCAVQTAQFNTLTINSPANLEGSYWAAITDFAPVASVPLTDDVVRVNDSIGVTDDACNTITNAGEIAGKTALIQIGACPSADQVEKAQAAGAEAVVLYNDIAGGETLSILTGVPGIEINIPVMRIQRSLGLDIVSALPGGVNATLYTYSGVDGGDVVNTRRWLMGEDTSFGALRDMWDPTCIDHPGKVSDEQYYCANEVVYDYGGVHLNSGVPNHAFALLVDGGDYNGQTINSIGMTKAAAIYWRAESVYQAPTTDFAGHADALEASCSDLTGQPIYDLVTGSAVSNEDEISPADCEQLAKVITATELRTPPSQCNYQPILEPDAPAFCADGLTVETAFIEDFEGSATGWTVNHQIVPGITTSFNTPEWMLTASLPGDHTGRTVYALNSSEYGNCTTTNETNTRSLFSPPVTVPNSVAPLTLTFDHYIATEADYDGGTLWIQVNDGAWVQLAADDFTFNGYNGRLASANYGNTNPLAGRDAFHGANEGAFKGSWGTTHVDLSRYAMPGDTLELAFTFGQDGCTGLEGWYVDNVQIYTCTHDTFLPAVVR